MSKTLLSHLAHTLAPQPEVVATRALAYILNADPIAAQALWATLHGQEAYGWKDVVRFEPEYSFPGTSDGRVDVAGLDAGGGFPILIEGKFWAGLTENQPGGYLRRLKPGQDLVFVVPPSRVVTLALKLKRANEPEEVSSTSWTDGGIHIHVISWQRLLCSIKDALNSNQVTLREEIDQVIGLCSKMDDEGFLPLSSYDLEPSHGRRIFQLAFLVDKVAEWIKARSGSPLVKPNKDVKWGGSGFSGRTMQVRNRKIWFNLYFSAFKWHRVDDVTSPYWMDVNTTRGSRLALHLERNRYGRFVERNDHIAMPIPVERWIGMEESDIIQCFGRYLEEVASEIVKLEAVWAGDDEADPVPVSEVQL